MICRGGDKIYSEGSCPLASFFFIMPALNILLFVWGKIAIHLSMFQEIFFFQFYRNEIHSFILF